ncbi:hypothetical protein [Wolbachia endosymbiont (group A) of Beris morrisii]|uniref:hypothetical protein n=1 Tax=unclassified Wolbachia TaxID=2640676 RepID=UPI003341028D
MLNTTNGVMPVLDTGIQPSCNLIENVVFQRKTSIFMLINLAGSQWALLHSTLSSDGLRQIYVMISNLAIPISVNLLSK